MLDKMPLQMPLQGEALALQHMPQAAVRQVWM
jgi:hypothetical protein